MHAFTNNLRKLINDETIKGSAVVSVSVFIGSVFAYFLQVFLARFLTVSEFGDFTAVLALSAIFGIPSASFGTALVKEVAKLNSSPERKTLLLLFKNLIYFQMSAGVIVFTILLLSKNIISAFLNISNSMIIVAFSVNIFSQFIFVVVNSYLQGMLKFFKFSFLTVIGGFFRLAIPAVIVLLGYRVAGVYVGLSLSIFLAFIIGFFFLGFSFEQLKNKEKLNMREIYYSTIKTSMLAFYMTIGMTFLNNADVVLVKHFFSSVDSGIYSSIVTVGKVLLFGSGTVAVVMYPQISSAFTKKENYKRKFGKFFIIQLIPVLAGLILFYFNPKFIINVLFGQKFFMASTLLPSFSLFVSLYVLVNFFLLYFLAISKTAIFVLIIPAAVIQVALISVFHNNLAEVINVNILSISLLFLALLLYYKIHEDFSDNSLLQKGKNNSTGHI